MNRDLLLGLSFSLLLLSIWEFFAHADDSIVFFVGSPSSISREFYKLITEERFVMHFFVTGSEALFGLFLGTVSGTALGLLTWYFRPVAVFLNPLIGIIGALPVFALAPLLILWFGIGFSMKVALAFLGTFFIAYSQAFRGARDVSDQYVDLLRAIRASRFSIFVKVIVPGSVGSVLNSMKLNASFCLLGAFIGEFIASDKGLGFLILRAASLYNMPRALAASIGIVILASMFHLFAFFLERHKNRISQLISVPPCGLKTRN